MLRCFGSDGLYTVYDFTYYDRFDRLGKKSASIFIHFAVAGGVISRSLLILVVYFCV